MKRLIIMGAAGRDFHNFNVCYRDKPEWQVVAFTATQIPNIAGRRYPPELAGRLYPEGIPIEPEERLPELIKEHKVQEVVFAYSDVSHHYVMERAAIAQAAGADFVLLGPESTMLKAQKPVVAITAVRTGAGKSQTTRRVSDILRAWGKRLAIVRHPMPYGDLVKQAVQRFASYADLDRHNCTIEEREEYEPHLDRGNVVFAGVDYERILREAEREADLILWDGGNNDFPFYKADLWITLADPHRAGDELTYWPGSVNIRAADVVVINKVDTASEEQVRQVRENVRKVNAKAMIIEAASPISVDNPALVKGKRALVIEDGPTLTHGEMSFGAGRIAAERCGAAELIDPRPFAVRSIAETLARYPQAERLLPAVGYGEQQVRDLAETIARAQPEVVLIGTPIDLRRLINFDVPAVRARYELKEVGRPTLEEILKKLL
ncbi:MAG: cyclic 2,3-diphosphoglycerate synthase [Candidatus Acetothermia bacterium]|jgi:predicted GTPase|nr:cyclic 2,3-diphosphoglycerate synthase [Candidatus Acetothermia bacterium]MDH7505337.1 cyclic 2,3-diphosphoglycerate synthase [Candidatus Acetothermia bacterium]